MSTWWRTIAITLGANPSLTGPWPKIVCETLGDGCVALPYTTWAGKVAGYAGLQPTNNAEELGQYIHEQGLLYGSRPRLLLANGADKLLLANGVDHLLLAA